MKNIKNYRQALRQATAPRTETDPQEFWADFKARAAITPQIGEENAPRIANGFHHYRFVAICTVILLTILAISLPEKTIIASAASISKVEEVDVYIECDSLLIIEDSENKGTVVWFDASPSKQE